MAKVDGLQSALDGKANASHTHAAGDITSGTLPIARGGTGASTAAAAMETLFRSGEMGYAAPSDNEVVLCSCADGAGQDMRPVRRTWSAVWEYMRSKASGAFAAKSHRHNAGDIDGLDAAVGGVKILYEEAKTINYEGDGRLAVDLRFSAFADNNQGRFVCAVLDVPRCVSNINEVWDLPEPVLKFKPGGVSIDVDGACSISPAYPYAVGEFWVRLTVYGFNA